MNGNEGTARRQRSVAARAAALLVVAGLAAVVAALLLTRYMDAKAAAARVPTVAVVVASVDIPVATPIKAEWLQPVQWPAASPPEGTFLEAAPLGGRIALVPIAKGEPILERKLAAPGANGGLATLLPEGMRAVAVRVDDVVGVAGFIHPGDHVDVIVTMRPGDNAPPVSKVILQNVQVLAVGKDVQRSREAEKAVSATVATLMVDPDASERLALTATQGKLLLALRAIGDEDLTATPGIRPPTLLAAVEAPAPAPVVEKPPTHSQAKRPRPPAPEPPQQQKQSVEILRGDLFEKRDFQ